MDVAQIANEDFQKFRKYNNLDPTNIYNELYNIINISNYYFYSQWQS